MTPERRQKLLLAVLGLLLAWLAVTRLGDLVGGGDGRGGRATSLATAAPIQGRFRLASDLADLDVEALENKPGSYTPGRDPFRFGQPPAPPREERPAPPPRREPVERPTQQAPPVASGPQPPPVDVAYLGNFGTASRTIAVFADSESIYNAFVGDVIKDKFRLVTIGYESVDLEFVGFPDAPAERLEVGK